MLQVLRDWPPGFGGVERVAHALAEYDQQQGTRAVVFSFAGQAGRPTGPDPVPVRYRRVVLPRICLGRLLLPLPSPHLITLLSSQEPLHGHLPCPGVLLVLVMARLIRPRRRVSAHWHAFLQIDNTPAGLLLGTYQQLALAVARQLPLLITTSPPLADALVRQGCDRSRIKVLPCCLDREAEALALALPLQRFAISGQLKVLFIGRLDSYKRVDWLISALQRLSLPWRLDVVGAGKNLAKLERMAMGLPVHFWGLLDETQKLERLAQAEVLVLPSDRCNEAFGIVQLEAMAAGLPSLAFDLPSSGMAWVSRIPGLRWGRSPDDLSAVLQMLASDRSRLARLSTQARQRYSRLFERRVWQSRFDLLGWH
jgi:glycosyltransferase involved in cell wall biosynthesis